jgi:Fe2+ or Zn2+ uptake regulation protein
MQLAQAGFPAKQTPEPGQCEAIPAERIVTSCARDIVRVLEEVGHPLTTLEILEELVHRHLSWRENTVRHALDLLLDQGAISDTANIRPHSYGLKGAL